MIIIRIITRVYARRLFHLFKTYSLFFQEQFAISVNAINFRSKELAVPEKTQAFSPKMESKRNIVQNSFQPFLKSMYFL